ncbi:MAG: hypothetical protein M3Q27_02325 [Actinomycetota bacterium]|nr:hypothetical protein [Actinomycetota bacterium]
MTGSEQSATSAGTPEPGAQGHAEPATQFDVGAPSESTEDTVLSDPEAAMMAHGDPADGTPAGG